METRIPRLDRIDPLENEHAENTGIPKASINREESS
jgi:hypothetical protein